MQKEAAIENWYKGHAIFMIVATIVFLTTQQLYWLPVFGALSFLYFIGTNRANWSTINWFGGYPNLATGFRLALFIGLMFIQQELAFYQIALIAIIVISFDGVDGYLFIFL